MIVLTGKYNDARVMTDNADSATIGQIIAFLNHEAFADTNIVVMPDCHYGAGTVIGYTAPRNDYIPPNIVGVDIGCGVAAYKLEGVTEIDFPSLDNFIRNNIPSGFSKHTVPLVGYWSTFKGYKPLFERVKDTVARTGQEIIAVHRSWQTKGGGNHFLEIVRAPDGSYWLVVHSGSRNFGLKVADFYQKKAVKANPSSIKGLEFLHAQSQDGQDYLEDMKVAQDYASLNRLLIASCIVQDFFGLDTGEVIESVHNYIGIDGIIRKGAISAYKGEKLVIPLNMRDGVIFGTGKGNADWNYSAPHGAGRLMARGQAKRELSLADFEKTMADAGVWSSCVSAASLDESPKAYKNGKEIMQLIGDTVDIAYLAPSVFSYKAT